MTMSKIPSQRLATHMVMVLFAPEDEKNDDHDQDFVTKTCYTYGRGHLKILVQI